VGDKYKNPQSLIRGGGIKKIFMCDKSPSCTKNVSIGTKKEKKVFAGGDFVVGGGGGGGEGFSGGVPQKLKIPSGGLGGGGRGTCTFSQTNPSRGGFQTTTHTTPRFRGGGKAAPPVLHKKVKHKTQKQGMDTQKIICLCTHE